MTAEQLEASRAERMRQNGHATLTLEDARTWIEETGLCHFLPRRQSPSSVAPSFVEAVAGQHSATPDQKHIQIAEELLVRLELSDVAVRLNLLGQPGEQPDFVVASWVLPYVYALRGDRDWRRTPQLTGSRQVSPLAIQAYKHLETGDLTISQLKQALGREVTEAGVVRAITELWQQLRIIPVISAPGAPAKWQLLRHRFQKAIAEGASTSQVTAISVLASIYLQAVIAASMEDVELFLAPLTARSKVREVLRGLLATRQVHTISLGHAPHFYVAGTLPEFSVAQTLYSSASMPANAYFLRSHEEEPREAEAPAPVRMTTPAPAPAPVPAAEPIEVRAPRPAAQRKPASHSKPAASRPHFRGSKPHSRDRKPIAASGGSRPSRRSAAETHGTNGHKSNGHAANGSRPTNAKRWTANGSAKTAHGKNGAHASNGVAKGAHSNGSRPANGSSAARSGKPAASGWNQRHANGNGHANGKPSTNGRSNGLARNGSAPRKDARVDARAARSSRKPPLTAGAKAGNSKRYGFTARPKAGTKKRG